MTNFKNLRLDSNYTSLKIVRRKFLILELNRIEIFILIIAISNANNRGTTTKSWTNPWKYAFQCKKLQILSIEPHI